MLSDYCASRSAAHGEPKALGLNSMTPTTPAGDGGRTLAGQSAWIISDGKAGHEVQALGVAAALGVEPILKRVTPMGLVRLAAPWAPVARAERLFVTGGLFSPPWPSIAFATGRTTIPYLRALRRRAADKIFTVILLDPKTGSASADVIWTPGHDALQGENVIKTLTSPHAYSAKRLADLRADLPADIMALPRPRTAILIGGPNRDYRYDDLDAQKLASAARRLALSGAGLMITSSRRTPPDLIEAVLSATTDKPRVLWTGAAERNPYHFFLAAADAFLVTADSVNMAGEAASTGRPIYVFTPAGTSAKFERFHTGLRAAGASRPLPEDGQSFETWSYEPLDSAATIAAEILTRWRKRASAQ